jgi:hypothetical protein
MKGQKHEIIITSLVSIKPNFLLFHSILGVEICPSFIEGCKKRPKGSHLTRIHIMTMCASADGSLKGDMLGRSVTMSEGQRGYSLL